MKIPSLDFAVYLNRIYETFALLKKKEIKVGKKRLREFLSRMQRTTAFQFPRFVCERITVVRST